MAKATNANKAGTTTTRPAYNRPLGRAAAKQTPEIIAVSEEHRPFRRINFIQMGICAGLILIGFLLMLGGGSSVEGGFNPDIFSTRRIVIGPAITFIGFLLMAFAIINDRPLHRRKKTEPAATEEEKSADSVQ